jgi:uncharacterized repeat protein (TIGR01451 family)
MSSRVAAVTSALLTLTLAASAQGAGQSLGPEPRDVFEGHMNYVATAGSLLQCGGGATCDLNTGGNCQGLDSGTAPVAGIPGGLPGLRVAYAQVNWVATYPQGAMPDAAVTLTPPGGAPIAAQADPARSEQFDDAADAQTCQLVQVLCSVGNCGLTFGSMVADVTDAVNAHLATGGVLNGDWRIDDVDVPGGDDSNPDTAIAAIGSLTVGGWSLLMVYEEASLPLRRLYYYQGFELIEGGVRRLHPTGFRAPPDPAVDVTFFALEGDTGTQGDSLTINDTDVEDDCNPFNNVFNETVNAAGMCRRNTSSVDLDTFHLEDAIEPGDEEADITITLPMGNGLTPGEQIFTDWLMIAFDHRPPNFDTLKPEKSAEPPSRSVVQTGDLIEYTILVENSGGEDATGVIVRDAPPPGTTYVPGSTTVDVIQIPDAAGGATVLAQGLELTRIPGIDAIGPMERHLVKFKVRVDADAPDGTILTNIASITADGLDQVRTDPVVHSVGILPDGGFPPPPDAGPDAGPRPDFGVVPTGDAAPPRPDGAPVICGPDEVVNAAGRCVNASADMGPERDACPYGTAESFCAQGTQLVDGKCEAICGAGTYWDPSCANGCGACQPEGVPTCAEAAGGKDSGKASSGCTLGGHTSGGPLWLAGLALAVTAARRRRENRDRR